MIAFTGTPIAEGERDTRRVFGDDIHTYGLLAAVEDGATVPVAFEPRIIKVERAEGVADEDIDDAAEEATEDLDEDEKDRIERPVAVLNTVYGAPERLKTLAGDLVEHWKNRSKAMVPFIAGPGKAMIVCATREIAAQLYEEIIALRPDWHDGADDKGKVKVVYSASPSDPELLKKHTRRPSATAAVKNRLKDAEDPLELIIVKDMMLTGFDAPPLHTLYLDRPLKGALLMQTLARVNRTYKGKPDGLLVAYAPIEQNLSAAMQGWTTGDDPGGEERRAKEAKDAAVEVLEALDVLDERFGPDIGFDWREVYASDPQTGPLEATKLVTNYLRDPRSPGNRLPDQPEKRLLAETFREITTRLAHAYAIAANVDDVRERQRDVRFYEQVRVWLAKLDALDRESRGEPIPDDVKRLLGDIVVTSTQSGGVIDIYKEAGLTRPRLDALTPASVEEASQPSRAQLAIEALRATLLSEMGKATANNNVRRQQFSERVRALMIRYAELQLTAAEMIQELAGRAEEVVADSKRGEAFSPALGVNELAFFNPFSENDFAAGVLDEDETAQLARDLVKAMRRDVRTDWTVREDIKARMRRNVKRLLRRHRFPVEQSDAAVADVMAVLQEMAPRWAEEQGD